MLSAVELASCKTVGVTLVDPGLIIFFNEVSLVLLHGFILFGEDIKVMGRMILVLVDIMIHVFFVDFRRNALG